MFNKTITKLTALYLGILMVICLFFSVPIYQLSVNELDKGLRGSGEPVFDVPLYNDDFANRIRNQLNYDHEEQYQQAKHRVLRRLVIVNTTILVAGGFLSYYMARRTLEPIEEAHERMSRFTADASHELRTPITAMQTENEVALLNPKLTLKEAKDQIASNIEELQRLTNLSEGLLSLASLENGDMQMHKISAIKVAKEALGTVEPLARAKKINIDKMLESKASIVGDKSSLIEALVIILDNAIKYSSSSGKIAIHLITDRNCVLFKVIDQGPGIKKQELQRIFERFYRSDSSRAHAESGGYGLGLAIAKNIVTSHHGTIGVISEPGKGSTFTIKLPLAR